MGARKAGIVCGLLLLAAGGALLGHDLYLAAKASAARVLIRRAFARNLADGRLHPPWPWADMVPVARLEFPTRGIGRYVLTGATGESLAFDLGHIHGTAAPGRPGNCVVAGHRDGRFSFLDELAPGETVRLVIRGAVREYVVESREVRDAGDAGVLESHDDRLTLVTCWPLDGFAPAAQRYVVSCRPRNGLRYADEPGPLMDRRRLAADRLPGEG